MASAVQALAAQHGERRCSDAKLLAFCKADRYMCSRPRISADYGNPARRDLHHRRRRKVCALGSFSGSFSEENRVHLITALGEAGASRTLVEGRAFTPPIETIRSGRE